MQLDFNTIGTDIHANAVAHGWWEQPRNFGEIIALCHSELSEAHEAYVAGRGPDDKLPGFPAVTVELADTVIRILDYAHHEKLPVAAAYEFVSAIEGGEIPTMRFETMLCRAHQCLSAALEADRIGDPPGEETGGIYSRKTLALADCLHLLFGHAENDELPLAEAILAKHEYNKSRPYKHGKRY